MRLLSRSHRALRTFTSLKGLLPSGVIAVVSAPLLATTGARAATLWVGGTSGDYNTAANWSPTDVTNSSGETHVSSHLNLSNGASLGDGNVTGSGLPYFTASLRQNPTLRLFLSSVLGGITPCRINII